MRFTAPPQSQPRSSSSSSSSSSSCPSSSSSSSRSSNSSSSSDSPLLTPTRHRHLTGPRSSLSLSHSHPPAQAHAQPPLTPSGRNAKTYTRSRHITIPEWSSEDEEEDGGVVARSTAPARPGLRPGPVTSSLSARHAQQHSHGAGSSSQTSQASGSTASFFSARDGLSSAASSLSAVSASIPQVRHAPHAQARSLPRRLESEEGDRAQPQVLAQDQDDSSQPHSLPASQSRSNSSSQSPSQVESVRRSQRPRRGPKRCTCCDGEHVASTQRSARDDHSQGSAGEGVGSNSKKKRPRSSIAVTSTSVPRKKVSLSTSPGSSLPTDRRIVEARGGTQSSLSFVAVAGPPPPLKRAVGRRTPDDGQESADEERRRVLAEASMPIAIELLSPEMMRAVERGRHGRETRSQGLSQDQGHSQRLDQNPSQGEGKRRWVESMLRVEKAEKNMDPEEMEEHGREEDGLTIEEEESDSLPTPLHDAGDLSFGLEVDVDPGNDSNALFVDVEDIEADGFREVVDEVDIIDFYALDFDREPLFFADADDVAGFSEYVDVYEGVATASPEAGGAADIANGLEEEAMLQLEAPSFDLAFFSDSDTGVAVETVPRVHDDPLGLPPDFSPILAPLASPHAVASGQDDAERDTEADCGDELAQLMRRAEAIKDLDFDALHPGARDNGYEDEGLVDEDDFDMSLELLDGEGEVDRREQALAFLESIPLRLLQQLHTSLVQVHSQDGVRLAGVGASGAGTGAGRTGGRRSVKRSKGSMAVLSDEEEEDDVERDEDKGVDWDQVGVKMVLKNRKTGGDMVTLFPDDPTLAVNKSTTQYKLACIMRVVQQLYTAILDNVVTTKRDIFYKDVALFGSQRVVDALVDDLAATAGLRRQDFLVCATSKGLAVSTSLVLELRSGEKISVSATNACLIPPIERIESLSSGSRGAVEWVLVVEKDAVFQTLCSSGLLQREDLGVGVLITGKGYPDLATLQLLSLIAETYPDARIHALVDADPHGIDILSVYTYGSAASRFSTDHAGLALGSRIEWMGVRASEWMSLGVRYEDLLDLSDKDVQKAHAMLRDREHMPAEWKRELVQMLHLNKKAEIQILSSLASQTSDAEADDVREAADETGAERVRREGGLMGYVVSRILAPRADGYDAWMVVDDL